MSDLSLAPRTRLFTAFGTVVYFDLASLELRHGEVESSPANALFVADPISEAPYRRGWLMHDAIGLTEPIICRPDGCRSTSAMMPTVLDLVPLERGLLGLTAEGLFLSAIPDGRISLSAPACSTWELFLASEGWCTDGSVTQEEHDETHVNILDTKSIKSYVVHPINRVRTNVKPRRVKLLIYGYLQWSHGRVYYDICKRLHREGYIVDILNWQINHSPYIKCLMGYYDLYMSALDGVSTLIDVYGVPHDRLIALSHHELDMQMLIEEKGREIFERFAGYGVVSEYLYGVSVMKGIRRLPMVVSLGINYDEFDSTLPERLSTVGYAGSMSVSTYGIEWKRGTLAEASANQAGLDFKIAGWTGNQTSFHDMPNFYRTVDAVLISSINEGAGLPAMEAAAAGRLVISTPVGHFPTKAYQGGGIIAPIEGEKFKRFAAATLLYYKENPSAFVEKCSAIRNAARKFDWQNTIGEWTDLIEAARSKESPVNKLI
jgi:glycosyltransferase involved in cell wall biosynthesis